MTKLAARASVRATPLASRAEREERLVRAFNEARAELVSTLYFLVGNQADAQDAAQEAFLKCWRAREGLAEVRNVRAWIFRVGLNAAKDLCRSAWRRRARPLLALPLASRQAAAADLLEQQEARDRLRAALLNLRREEKEVFLLRQNADLTYEEIGALCGRPTGTIKTQMRAALHKLRAVLQESVVRSP